MGVFEGSLLLEPPPSSSHLPHQVTYPSTLELWVRLMARTRLGGELWNRARLSISSASSGRPYLTRKCGGASTVKGAQPLHAPKRERGRG